MIINFTLLTFTHQRLLLFLNSDFEIYFLKGVILLIISSLIFLIIRTIKKRYSHNLLSNTKVSFDKNFKEVEIGSISKLIELALGNNPLFYNMFARIFPDFIANLLEKNPTLKTSDLELCAMLKLNLDTKQIATIKNVTVKSIESKKYRLRKKLSIPSETDLYLWISKI